MNYSGEKRYGKKKNDKHYQFDVYFADDHQGDVNYFCKNRSDMGRRKYIT